MEKTAKFLREHGVFYDTKEKKWHFGRWFSKNLVWCLYENGLSLLFPIYKLTWGDIHQFDNPDEKILHNLGLVKNLSE